MTINNNFNVGDRVVSKSFTRLLSAESDFRPVLVVIGLLVGENATDFAYRVRMVGEDRMAEWNEVESCIEAYVPPEAK